MNRREFLAASLAGAAAASTSAAAHPKVRCVTAFVRLDRARWEQQVRETLAFLRAAKRTVESAGYPVETIRIVTQPFGDYTKDLSRPDALQFLREYDKVAQKESFAANIGPAMLSDSDDPARASLLGEVLASTKTLRASLIIGNENGIQWKCLETAARLIRFVAENSPASAGNFNFAATATLAPYGPFYPGAYHLGDSRRFAIGLEGAGVVDEVFGTAGLTSKEAPARLARALGLHAGAIEKAAVQIETEGSWAYVGIDATPAPLHDISIGAAMEKFTGARFGTSGTMTAAAVITKAVQSLPVKRAGFSGLMLPVMEDELLARRWGEGAYGIDALLAYSAVCGTGLDTIPLAGDTTERQLARILGDMASLAVKWNKPLTARLLPVKGKKAGEVTTFEDPFMTNTTVRAVD